MSNYTLTSKQSRQRKNIDAPSIKYSCDYQATDREVREKKGVQIFTTTSNRHQKICSCNWADNCAIKLWHWTVWTDCLTPSADEVQAIGTEIKIGAAKIFWPLPFPNPLTSPLFLSTNLLCCPTTAGTLVQDGETVVVFTLS